MKREDFGDLSDLFGDDIISQYDELQNTVNGRPMEEVRDPSNATEWFECLVLEYIWKTDRVFQYTTELNRLSNALMSRGYSPDEAASFIIKKQGLEELPSNTDWDLK